MRLAIAMAVAASAGTAYADTTFEAQAQGAQVVTRIDDLVWALTATCDGLGDVQARQCRQVRDGRAKALRAQPLMIEGEDGAFIIGEYDAVKKSAPTSLNGCIRCKPVTLDGTSWIVYAGTPKQDVGRTITPLTYERARQFPDAAAFASWKKSIGPTRVHFVVAAKDKAVKGVAVTLEIIGYRVVSACTGEVLASSSSAQPIAADKTACTK